MQNIKNSVNKILVLCVDRDDDVGSVTGIKTPIVGREKNIEVAVKFAVKAPEDSDVNAIFAAIGVYDDLKKEGIDCEVATVSGIPEGSSKADMKISKELEQILQDASFNGVILVSDGASDEAVIPIIQSKLPILSIRRVIIQQERSVEETYILIARYLKRIIVEPQYARIFLGVPGAIFLLLAILQLSGYAQYTTIGALMILGTAFVVRGFSIDRIIMNWWKSSPIIFFSSFMTSIAFMVSIYEGINGVIIELSLEPNLISNITKMIGLFLVKSIDIFLVGTGILIIGKLIDKYLGEKEKLWHEIVSLVFIVTIRPVIQTVSSLLIDPNLSNQSLITPLLLTTGITLSLIVIFTLLDRIKKRKKEGQQDE